MQACDAHQRAASAKLGPGVPPDVLCSTHLDETLGKDEVASLKSSNHRHPASTFLDANVCRADREARAKESLIELPRSGFLGKRCLSECN